MIAGVVVHSKHDTAVIDRKRIIFDEAQQRSRNISSSNGMANFILDAFNTLSLMVLRDKSVTHVSKNTKQRWRYRLKIKGLTFS